MKRYASIFLLLVLLVPVAGFGAQEEEEQIDYSKITLDVNNFNQAGVCGQCHIDIYALWSNSLHSKALVDPAFYKTFIEDRIQGDTRIRDYCIQCHAPAVYYNPTLDLNSDLATEGVTCDFCHSIQDVDLTNTKKPFLVKWGRLKRGPFKDTQSPVHETKHSPLFESGDLCGGCHEMQNLNNLPIITTYSEWKEGYQKRGGEGQCQDCHMPLAAGFTVSAKHRKTKRRINLHSFPGGHSRAQLLDALRLEILDESKLYGKMKVKLGLTNVGAGHYVPTGNPLRKVIVDFSAYNALNRLIFNEQVELSKQFGDPDGERITTDVGVLLDASQVLKDNRIAPGETKELIFEFLAPNERLLVEAKVIYVYENSAFPEMKREEKLITFTKIVNKDSPEKTISQSRALSE